MAALAERSTETVVAASPDRVSAADRADAAPARKKTGYIRTLDGWRTLAIGSVMFYHARPISFGPVHLDKVQQFGDRGVQLFFAISGILICSRLLEEQRMHGEISLKGFYIRRLFRIQPAAILFLVGVGLLTLFGVLHPTLPATLSALFSYRNFYAAADKFVTPDDRYTAHFWSLAVEEHFYLILPALLVFARKKIVPVLSVATVLFFFWEPLAHSLGIYLYELSDWRTDMALRNLLFPALLAVLLTRPSFRAWMTKYSAYNGLIVLTVVAILLSQSLLKGHLTGALVCFGFPLMVLTTMLHPEAWLGRLLESAPMVFLGRISYGLYLWEQLFFTRQETTSSLRFLQVAPWNIVAAVLCATVSYFLVEKPLMKLGHRLAPPATPGRPDLIRSSGI
jgi:peptidoglycan/LPS O-acetylase OafA/YrhL